MLVKKQPSKRKNLIMVIVIFIMFGASFFVLYNAFFKKPKLDQTNALNFRVNNFPIAAGNEQTSAPKIGTSGSPPAPVIADLSAASQKISELDLFSRANYKYIYPPVIYLANPKVSSLAGLVKVTITGANFGVDQGNGSVFFGAEPVSEVSSWSNDKIEIIAPAHQAGFVDIVVRTNISPEAKLEKSFQYLNLKPPQISSVSPASGLDTGNTKIIISGSNFGASQGQGGVLFAEIPAAQIEKWTDVVIEVVTPSHATGAVPLIVKTDNGLQNSAPAYFEFKKFPLPEIYSISPNKGSIAGQTDITITGLNFGAKKGQVFFNDIPVKDYSEWTDAKIIVKSPASSPGQIKILVVTNLGLTSKDNPLSAAFMGLRSSVKLPLELDQQKIGNPRPFDAPKEESATTTER